MKKIISVILVLCFALTLASCGKSENPSPAPDETGTQAAADFVKPEEYSSVLLVSIDSQFKLYLDEDGKVLAIEAVNEDAEAIKDNISFENESYETVVKNIVTEANKKGFVDEDATVSLEIVESKETNEAKSEILSKAENEAKLTANELKIDLKVNVAEIKTENEANTSAGEESTTSGKTETKPNETQQSAKPAHTHSFSAATCTEPKKCSCGAVDGKALGHNYKDGVCTRCKAKDPNYKPLTSVLEKQGKWAMQYLNGDELYVVTLNISNSDTKSVGVGIGDLFTTLPEEMQNNPNIKNDCKTYNGKEYFIGKGDGREITSVTENNGTVTLTDSSGSKLVLTRTGENTLKCTSVTGDFGGAVKMPVGSVFTFAAE